MKHSARVIGGVAALVMLTAALGSAAGASGRDEQVPDEDHHVLLLSVDGLHQSDLSWYISQNPTSALARLSRRGVNYTNAQTPVPSDSFPGLLAQVTGGNPRSTGVYYDFSYNPSLLAPGTTACSTTPRGTVVAYDESLDQDPSSIDAGQGLAGLPGSILSMAANPTTLINPANLPVDPTTCKPVYPHQYLKVNTVFEVARRAGLRTAWSDKHPAYDIVNGPSGNGVQDLFTPEINSDATGYSGDWTSDNLATQQYDTYKVQSVINEIDGYDHSRTVRVGTPAMFGMNFQSVSTGEKLPTSQGQPGGYLADGVTPGPVLARALDFVNTEVQALTAELRSQHLADSTTIILSAKHGQSPQDGASLRRVDDGSIIDGLNAAWAVGHPSSPALVAGSISDDAMLLWLSDRSQAAADFAKIYLLSTPAAANTIDGTNTTVNSSGLSAVYAGAATAGYFGVAPGDPRVPDVFGIAQHGTVYTGKKKKIAEHGGADPQDRHVPIIVFGAGVDEGRTITTPVETTQIAPTILEQLDLNPRALRAVRQENTRVLPGLR